MHDISDEQKGRESLMILLLSRDSDSLVHNVLLSIFHNFEEERMENIQFLLHSFQ